MKIQKRDGTYQNFDRNKIIDAIFGAFNEVDGEISDYAVIKAGNIADYIGDIAEERTLTIEEIQDMVEKGLASTKRKDVAKAYILYRDKRTRERNKRSALTREVGNSLFAKNVENSNANMDEHSFGGKWGSACSVITKDYALNYILSEKARNNHLQNRIYIHDLDHYALGDHNCLSIPFDDLLANGFNTRQTDVRPANSINTAFQLLAVIFQLQSLNQFGGVSATHLDWTMVPYVRKSFFKHYLLEYLKDRDDFYELDLEEMTEEELDEWVAKNKEYYLSKFNLKEEDFYIGTDAPLDRRYHKRALFETRRELKQAVEGMFHNLNTLQSRSGCQLPFTSINYGTCTLPEGRMVIKALLEGSLKGVGKYHKTSVFPCCIFQFMKGVNDREGTPNYDLFKLAVKVTAQRLYPNYANVDWSGNAGYDINDPRTYFSTMGCRTANGFDINGFGQLKDGRGNICPVTIILPTLAMEARKLAAERNLDTISFPDRLLRCFFEILEDAINDAKDMLIERFDYICSQDASSARFMYENGTMAGYIPEEGIRSALKHGTLAVGQIGLAETLQILIGKDHTTDEGMELAKRVEQLFKDKCAVFKEKYKLNFGVYFTPAENLCYTAMNKFKATYGVIENVSDRDYFTNSIHVPVWKEVSPIEKINIESQLTGYSSAGCITYVELDGSAKHNLEALESIIKYAMDKDVPYFAINVPNDLCLDCGYSDEMNDTCPQCGSENIQRLRRVTGYLTGDYRTAFNPGKIAETEQRFKHSKMIPGWQK